MNPDEIHLVAMLADIAYKYYHGEAVIRPRVVGRELGDIGLMAEIAVEILKEYNRYHDLTNLF